MKALVCGAGIAGFTLAWWLERDGWDVEVVDQAPGLRSGGYLIDFYGAGYRVAEQMGLAARLEDVRCPVSALHYFNRHGRRTATLDTTRSLEGVVTLLRADLARVIGEGVRAPVAYGVSVRAAGGDLAGALARYQERMRPTIRDTQRFGRRFVNWMAPPTLWRIAARDLLLRLASLPGGGRLLRRSLNPGSHSLIRRRPTTLDV